MIIPNGTLQTIETTGGGMEKGRPIPVHETLGAPMECNIKTNTSDYHGVGVDGIFKRTDCTVLIDAAATPVFTARRVVLTDNRGQHMGEFRVQDIQHLDYVAAIQITLNRAD